eukprot:scaffold124916_cov18-Tisochrysis_lutea.AAC.1
MVVHREVAVAKQGCWGSRMVAAGVVRIKQQGTVCQVTLPSSRSSQARGTWRVLEQGLTGAGQGKVSLGAVGCLSCRG